MKLLIKLFLLLILLPSLHLNSQELKPGDGVRITFYNISDPITGDYFIQPDGNVQLPYIGLVSVANRSFDAIFVFSTLYDSLNPSRSSIIVINRSRYEVELSILF